jgi:hypothetical protein
MGLIDKYGVVPFSLPPAPPNGCIELAYRRQNNIIHIKLGLPPWMEVIIAFTIILVWVTVSTISFIFFPI